MRKLMSLMLVAAAVCMAAGESRAGFIPVNTYNITPTSNPFRVPTTSGIFTGLNNSQAQINLDIAPILGKNPDDIFVYKQNTGGPEEGGFAADYTTSFSNTPTDPSGALITWNNFDSNFINHVTDWLLVKDGRQNPAWYLFNISGWNGMDTLSLTGFWPQQGAISHVSLYGDGAPVVIDPRTTEVPEPSSMIVALSMMGIGAVVMRRRKKAALVTTK